MALLPLSSHAVGADANPPVQSDAGPAAAGVKPRSDTSPEACAKLAGSVWPINLVERRALIGELQRMRPRCLEDAPFLAVLGALLLEEGDAEQALVWLERSLLLDPDNLGARADHALALAAMGQPGALQDMSNTLRNRTDVPAALRQRLVSADPSRTFALPSARLGQATKPNWGTLGEVSLLTGYEGNLDRAPRLSELTLTFPDGPPLVLPVTSQPRSGWAALGSAALQLAYAPQPATVLRTGLALTARRASAHRATDWQQWQWATSAGHSLNGLRGQVDFSLAGFGGPLGEPYQLRKLSLAAEGPAQDCRWRAAVEGEQRVQSRTISLDSVASGWMASVQCPLFMGTGVTWSLAVRGGRDRPDSPDRPGGLQRLGAAGLRVATTVWTDTRIEMGWRSSTAKDETGFSPLLENNAPRRLTLRQWSLELTTPLHQSNEQRLEAVLQWQSAAQSSNLQLFRYRANSLYGGVRWLW